jgi:alpha-aminoadipate carrier protein LysW
MHARYGLTLGEAVGWGDHSALSFFPPAWTEREAFFEIHFLGGYRMQASCPECEAEISMDKPMRGEIIVCPDCGAELEVTNDNPLTLDLAPQEEEDWGE